MEKSITVFALPGHEALGEHLTWALNAERGMLTVRNFPDGETYVRVDTDCDGKDVVLAATLHHPNSLRLPLAFCAQAARDVGARRVVLVVPYLAYLRQDARFQPGEAITSKVFASYLNVAFDGLVTVDSHLHRYASLDELYSIPTRVVHAAPALATWIREHIPNALIVGPDRESEQWVSEVARLVGAPFISRVKFGVEIETSR